LNLGFAWDILESYREALGKQLLAPAPDMASVEWKRRQLKEMPLLNVTRQRVEKAIADDIAFLDAHPTRKARTRLLRDAEKVGTAIASLRGEEA
jgi:hypothetical protein